MILQTNNCCACAGRPRRPAIGEEAAAAIMSSKQSPQMVPEQSGPSQVQQLPTSYTAVHEYDIRAHDS